MSSPIEMDRLYALLHATYGPQGWWPAKSDFGMMVGAILVQNTAWTGAARAVEQLDQAGELSPVAIRRLGVDELGMRIRASGYFRLKAKRLTAFCAFLQTFDDDLTQLFALPTEPLRERLLGVYGIGEETADSILCYAGKRAVFVVDAYTKRLFARLGWMALEKISYGQLQRLVHESFPANAKTYGEFHALIVRHAKEHCRKRPVCEGCAISFCRART
ncbi:MAG: hypothetical protein H7832_09220 [Magnetococcus sp. DMHC-6]